MQFIHLCGRASQKKGKQLYTDLLNDVERTLTWLAQTTNSHLLLGSQDTDWRATHLMPSIVRVWERLRKPILNNG